MTDDAFAERLMLHHSTVAGLVFNRLRTHPEADVDNFVSETLERGWTHREQLIDRPDHEIRGWLCRTATNLTIDWLRRSDRRNVPLLPEQITVRAFPVGSDRHVDVLVLRDALHQIPEGQRRMLLEAYSEELTYVEMGARRGTTWQAVKSKMHRCRLTAREAVREVAL